MYFENWKEKNIFADLFHKPDTGIDPNTLDLFKQACKKDKLIFTASVVGPSRTQVGRLRNPDCATLMRLLQGMPAVLENGLC